MAEQRGRGRSKRRPTKDRVLQARIPEQLDEELRDRAEQLGLSVSTIVRNVLLHTFDLVEGVVTDSAQIGRVLQGRGATAAPDSGDRAVPESTQPDEKNAVVGWQEATLNLNGVCDSCNTILPAGERAAIGLPVQARPVLLCLQCLETLSSRGRQQDFEEKPNAKPPGRGRKTVE